MNGVTAFLLFIGKLFVVGIIGKEVLLGILKNICVLEQTRTSDCRGGGGTGLKTVFVSVCDNLQHM